MEYHSEMHLQRLQARAMETEARLQKQKKDSEEHRYLEKIKMEQKLAALAEERQRTKNVINYRELSRPADSSGDGGNMGTGAGSAADSFGEGEKKNAPKKKKKFLKSSKSLQAERVAVAEAEENMVCYTTAIAVQCCREPTNPTHCWLFAYLW
jgi:hypothetical protein